MEDLKIDSETASLIVRTYQNISTLRKLFNEEPYLQIMEVIESGKTLNEMMNSTFEQASPNISQTKLISMSDHLKSLLAYSESLQNIQANENVRNLFNQLLIDISAIQSKFQDDEKQRNV